MSLILFMCCAVPLALVAAFLILFQPKLRVSTALVVLLCGTAIIVFTWKPIYKTHLPQFAAAVKQVIDPDQLQKWAVSTLKESKPDSSEIPLNTVPGPIRNLRSNNSQIEYALCSPGTSPKDSYIVLMWGGGFGHWGIDVGAPSFRATR
jgi:hypothetical protein